MPSRFVETGEALIIERGELTKEELPVAIASPLLLGRTGSRTSRLSFLEQVIDITITSERIGHWTKMRQSRAPFSGSDLSIHTRSLADFITITFGFRFSVHTPAWNYGIGRQRTWISSHPRSLTAIRSPELMTTVVVSASTIAGPSTTCPRSNASNE
jgi:hypothetical protein